MDGIRGKIANREYRDKYNYKILMQKNKKFKHYVIYKYTFPVEMFKILNLEINQGTRTFKITPKKNF